MSFDDFVRPSQHIRRNRQADLFCRFQIDDELELLWLLNWQVSGLRALQDLVHVGGGATVQVAKAHGVGHESPGFHNIRPPVYRRVLALYREVCKLCALRSEHGTSQQEDCVSTLFTCGLKCSLDILGISYV